VIRKEKPNKRQEKKEISEERKKEIQSTSAMKKVLRLKSSGIRCHVVW
jgi:hypothetical protein